ncbi:MAG: hypothetical protein ACLQAH_05235 [Limisphaerales bacterium]
MKSPSECTDVELEAFVALVRQAGEVAANGLSDRVRAAERLFFLRDEAGIWTPNRGYGA